MFAVCNRRPRMFLLAARSDAPVAHPQLCGHVVVVPPTVAASGALPLEDMAIPLPPAAAYSADVFHERCLHAMEAASHVWASCNKLGEYIDASLRAHHVHHTCTHQVRWQPHSPTCTLAGEHTRTGYRTPFQEIRGVQQPSLIL